MGTFTWCGICSTGLTGKFFETCSEATLMPLTCSEPDSASGYQLNMIDFVAQPLTNIRRRWEHQRCAHHDNDENAWSRDIAHDHTVLPHGNSTGAHEERAFGMHHQNFVEIDVLSIEVFCWRSLRNHTRCQPQHHLKDVAELVKKLSAKAKTHITNSDSIS